MKLYKEQKNQVLFSTIQQYGEWNLFKKIWNYSEEFKIFEEAYEMLNAVQGEKLTSWQIYLVYRLLQLDVLLETSKNYRLKRSLLSHIE